MADINDDITKYLNGELTPTQMHALERKALSDPFLAEALEGASSVSHQDFGEDLGQLRKALHDKTKRKDGGGSFHWNWPLRIAAGLILLAVSSYLILNLVQKNKEQQDVIALNKQEKLPTPETSTEQPSKPSEGNVPPDTKKDESINEADKTLNLKEVAPGIQINPNEEPSHESPITKSERQQQITTQDESQKSDQAAEPVVEQAPEKSAELAQEKVTFSESIAQDDISFKKKERNELARSVPDQSSSYGIFKTTKPQSDSFSLSDSIQMLSVAGTKVIRGKVTDIDDGLPIPGVNVVAKGNQAGAVTDLNGNYQLTVPADADQLVFSFIGLETKEVKIPTADDNPKQDTREDVDVTMSQDVSELSEVVVVGYSEQSDKEFEGTRWELAEPEGGRKAYKDYLEKNLLYPQVAIENNVEGKVSVQFTIQPNGQLTDFRVMKSLGYGCDEEVIRLIKEGPQWKPTKRNSDPVLGKGKVKMRFTLPKKKKN